MRGKEKEIYRVTHKNTERFLQDDSKYRRGGEGEETKGWKEQEKQGRRTQFFPIVLFPRVSRGWHTATFVIQSLLCMVPRLDVAKQPARV